MASVLTTNEVAALVDIDEKRVRKEIEHGIFERPSFTFADAVYLRVLALLEMHLSVEDRARLHEVTLRALAATRVPETIDLDRVLELKVGPLAEFVRDRWSRFEEWKARRVVANEGILGG